MDRDECDRDTSRTLYFMARRALCSLGGQTMSITVALYFFLPCAR
jgi:hypothetical protein